MFHRSHLARPTRILRALWPVKRNGPHGKPQTPHPANAAVAHTVFHLLRKYVHVESSNGEVARSSDAGHTEPSYIACPGSCYGPGVPSMRVCSGRRHHCGREDAWLRSSVLSWLSFDVVLAGWVIRLLFPFFRALWGGDGGTGRSGQRILLTARVCKAEWIHVGCMAEVKLGRVQWHAKVELVREPI